MISKVNILKKLRFFESLKSPENRTLNEMYYENPEGTTYSDYEMWTKAAETTHSGVQIIPEGDAEAAYMGHEVVGFWDHTTNNGIVYNLNLAHKESVETATFQTIEFSPMELEKIQQIVPSAINDESGLIYLYNDQYALVKFESGAIELVQKQGEQYLDYKVFNTFDEMLQGITKQLQTIQENNSVFNLQGFQENMEPYILDIDKCIDYDNLENIYFVTIPFSQIRPSIKLAHTAATTEPSEIANKIIRIAQLYPKCKSATLNSENQTINLVFNNF